MNSDNNTATIETDCALSDLSHLGLIRITGDDARTLLQGQLTNDINRVTRELSQLSAMCNPKGRIFSNFHIFQREDALYLQLQRSVLNLIQKRLSMFVLMSKVEISDASSELTSMGLTGDCAHELIDNIPADTFGCITEDQLTILRHPGEILRVQLIGPADIVEEKCKQFAEKTTTVNADFWPLMDIRAGIASVHTATSEAFIPQMLNLDLIDGVSFTKGCFTGQEIVARMHYLGKSKRRMYRARIASSDAPLPNGELFSASSKSGQSHGNIVDARPSPDGGYEALVVTQTSSMDTADLTFGDKNGPAVVLTEPPYSLIGPE